MCQKQERVAINLLVKNIKLPKTRKRKSCKENENKSHTLSSSGFPIMFRSAEYISAEKHCGVSKCTDKLPSLVSIVNHAGMLTWDIKLPSKTEIGQKYWID